MPSALIYADTERNTTLRHEVPLAIGDPFLYVEHDGRTVVLTNVLEHERIQRVVPGVECIYSEQLGQSELVEQGVRGQALRLEILSRAVKHVGLREATVPPDFPLALADRLRADGVALTVDHPGFSMRRRAKNERELEGIRRAQVAAEAGLDAAVALFRAARIEGEKLIVDGEVLTAEAIRAAVRVACAANGAPALPDTMVTSLWSGGGHEPGSGPLPAHLPIEIDLAPQDEESGCYSDMCRTFVVGEVSEEVAAPYAVVRESYAASCALVRPGASCRALYDAAAEVIEAAGYPTRRTAKPGEVLSHGFYFALGHGVGLDIHEPPIMSLAGDQDLVEGDVIAVEPGIEGLPIGGVRLEDCLLVTADGYENLADYTYELAVARG